MKTMHKAVITKTTAPSGASLYNVQIWTSVDGGKRYAYCGQGRFCSTEHEALEYAASIPDAVVVLA